MPSSDSIAAKRKVSASFRFKQFTVRQDRAAMKVGFDGILLGAWADLTSCRRILDAGTGTGLIALMLAQRTQRSVASAAPHIDAVELDPQACLDATDNVRSSPWQNRISLIHSSLHNFASHDSSGYQLIVSNPPYFARGIASPDRGRAVARQGKELSFEHLCRATTRIMDIDGRLCVILPANSYEQSCDTASLFHLSCRRTTWVRPTPAKQAHRVLAEFRRQPGTCESTELTIEQRRHVYTEEFRELTRDFYLAF